MGTLLLIWLGLLAVLIVFAIGRPREGGALVLSYVLSLSLIHVPGVLPFVTPDYVPGAEETQRGLELTLLGMAAFIAGAVLAKWTGRRPMPPGAPPSRLFERLSVWALAVGVVCYFAVLPIAARVPSLTAVVSPLGTLLVIGLWLRLYSTMTRGETSKTMWTLAALPLLPMATLGAAGFIGYGVNWVISVVAFLFVISRRRILFYGAAPVVVFLGLSLFVAYMGERTGIRDLVWKEHASVTERLGRMSQIVTHFKPLNLRSSRQADALNDRLNQNYLVGRGVEQHEEGISPFLYGGTMPVWAFVPRAMWPDKPVIGGGRDIVARSPTCPSVRIPASAPDRCWSST